jgi:hypothetical protein
MQRWRANASHAFGKENDFEVRLKRRKLERMGGISGGHIEPTRRVSRIRHGKKQEKGKQQERPNEGLRAAAGRSDAVQDKRL